MGAVSLGCARCGACCQSIPMTGLDRMIELQAEGQNVDNQRWQTDVTFMALHWTPTGEVTTHGTPTYRCDQYDPIHMLCAIQDDKPPVCQDYPFYSSTPESYSPYLERQCSYLLDVSPEHRPDGARPLIPVEVITHDVQR